MFVKDKKYWSGVSETMGAAAIRECDKDKDIEKANSDRVNASLSILALNIKRRLNWLFADDRINPNALVPSAHLEKKITWYLQKVDNIALARLSNSFEQKLKAQIDKLIGGIYRKSNGITSSIISKDLGKLGYDI